MTRQTNSPIVVPIDFSDFTPAVLEQALSLAESPDALRFIHVLQPLSTISPGATWGHIDDEKRIAAVKQHFNENYSRFNVSADQLEVRIGSPGFVIADFAKEISANLIVIASHGHHGLPRLLLGSVTERVIRESHCNIFVLRGQ